MPPQLERAAPAPPVLLPRPLPGWSARLLATARDYVALTKPRVISLLLVTTAAAMVVADPSHVELATLALTLLGGYLAAGGAGAINHFIERETDARMGRTRGRPLATGRLEPWRGLAFGVVLSVLSMVVLAAGVNLLAAGLAACGLLGYVFVYTLWLKPSTPQNIVIGGAAGAFPPLVGWAAATGGLDPAAWWLFAIVFFWTPPHFWALSLLVKSDYARSGIPMLPVVRGEDATRRQILAYSLILVPLTLGPVATGLFGATYAATALVLGVVLLWMGRDLLRGGERPQARRLYLYSLLYLAVLFGAMALDRALGTI